MSHLQALDAYFTEHRERHLAELNEFLRIPSISALSEHKADMTTAANWLAEHLKALNIENVAVEQTASTLLSMVNGCTQKASQRFYFTVTMMYSH